MLLRNAALLGFVVLALLHVVGCDSSASQEGGQATGTVAPNLAATKAGAWFEEVAVSRGLNFAHRSGHEEIHYMPEAAAGGGGLFDMDGDGDLDAYLVQSGSLTRSDQRLPGNQLYENLGDGTFKNVTPGSGAEDPGYGMGVACGDYDDDGDVDLYVTNEGPNRLLRNDGTGVFQEVSQVAGVDHDGWGSSAGFLDYDRDGDLDLFVVNYINWSIETELACYNQMGGKDYCSPLNFNAPAMDTLYRNNGDGTFTDVTKAAGMNVGFGNGLGFSVGDYDGDGWLDIFVANDGLVDQLWINQQDGTFVDKALVTGCAVDMEGGVPKAGMGVTTGDVDNDGDLDLMVCNLVNESDSVYRNEGQYFDDVTSSSGLGAVSRQFTRFGMGWVDFNNDGLVDLYQANGRVMSATPHYSDDGYAEPNVLFAGVGRFKFSEVKPRGGTKDELIHTSRGAAFGDVDNDGALDIIVVNKDGPTYLLHNQVAASTSPPNNWVAFSVRERSGRDAEGAIVTLQVGEETMRRDVRSGYSYLACNDPRVRFGLGPVDEVESVTVTWVDGAQERFSVSGVGQVHTIRRGEGTAH